MASSNGGVPPGFRFHPTDEELLHYYLKKKVTFQKFDLEVIREVDLNKMEPWDLQEKCKIGSTPQNEWYFFSHKDRKYPTGSRTNRATSAGFWKATGRDKCIRNSYKKIGMRKTLVFYRGRAPHGQKTDWIMHEYRLEENVDDAHSMNGTEDGWVVCRVFKKKNLFKVGNEGRSSLGAVGVDRYPIASSSATTINNGTPEALNLRDHHLLHYVHGRQEAGFQGFELALHHHFPPNIPATHFTRIPHDSLESPKLLAYDFPAVTGESPAMMKQFLAPHRGFDDADQSLACQVQVHHQACDGGTEVASGSSHEPGHGQQMVEGRDEGLNEWAILVSMGQENPSKAARFGETTSAPVHQISQLSVRGEMDLWGYGK